MCAYLRIKIVLKTLTISPYLLRFNYFMHLCQPNKKSLEGWCSYNSKKYQKILDFSIFDRHQNAGALC